MPHPIESIHTTPNNNAKIDNSIIVHSTLEVLKGVTCFVYSGVGGGRGAGIVVRIISHQCFLLNYVCAGIGDAGLTNFYILLHCLLKKLSQQRETTYSLPPNGY